MVSSPEGKGRDRRRGGGWRWRSKDAREMNVERGYMRRGARSLCYLPALSLSFMRKRRKEKREREKKRRKGREKGKRRKRNRKIFQT
jgi:hypothetical protein